MKTSFYNRDELVDIGFRSFGENVLISRNASFYQPELIAIGNNVRIDDFCVLSGKVTIGNNVHIAVYSGLFGSEKGIIIADFANISSRVCIYAISDDYSGMSLTNPMIPDHYKCLEQKEVRIEKHVIIGTGSTVLPGVTIGEGAAVGAMSLVKTSIEGWNTYAGIPIKKIGARQKKILELELEYIKDLESCNS